MRSSEDAVGTASRWTDAVFRQTGGAPSNGRLILGVLPGEGIGPEVVTAALRVGAALEVGGLRLDVRTGGATGRAAEAATGTAFTEEVAAFCDGIFRARGAVLAGPGGGRFVYDMRRRFDLYCKISPIRPIAALAETARVKATGLSGVDILVVRENSGGEYLGRWSDTGGAGGERVCEHAYHYSEPQVRRLVDAAARLAASRRGRLAVVVKEGGLPAVSALWRDVASDAAARTGVALRVLDIDLAAYLLVQEPLSFDVLATSNLFGDVLADLGAVLLASRGVSFSGNFSEDGASVYQTNHGSALDLAGLGRANPVGQINALAMALRESFGRHLEAAWIEDAVEEVLGLGFRTFDVAIDGARVVGTAEIGERIGAAVERRARSGE